MSERDRKLLEAFCEWLDPDATGEQHSRSEMMACVYPFMHSPEFYALASRPAGEERDRQAAIAESPWFREAYEGRSLGESMAIDDHAPARPDGLALLQRWNEARKKRLDTRQAGAEWFAVCREFNEAEMVLIAALEGERKP